VVQGAGLGSEALAGMDQAAVDLFNRLIEGLD